jgi:hypothetical protein
VSSTYWAALSKASEDGLGCLSSDFDSWPGRVAGNSSRQVSPAGHCWGLFWRLTWGLGAFVLEVNTGIRFQSMAAKYHSLDVLFCTTYRTNCILLVLGMGFIWWPAFVGVGLGRWDYGVVFSYVRPRETAQDVPSPVLGSLLLRSAREP